MANSASAVQTDGETIAKEVLREYRERITKSNVDPRRLADNLFSANIVGIDDVEMAKNTSTPASERLGTLVMSVMKMKGRNVFRTIVDFFLGEPEYEWLGTELKDAFIGKGGVWDQDAVAQQAKPTGGISGTLRSEGDEGLEHTTMETNKRGLAILVTCDYKGSSNSLSGTNADAREMEKTVDEFKYHLIQVKNEDATKSGIKSAIEDVSEEDVDVIMFVFSGHGARGGHILSQDEARLSLKDDIIHPLLTKRKTPDIPVLFFVDACRGSGELVSKSDSDQPMSDGDKVKGWIQKETNFRIDYATIDHHVAYTRGKDEESRWLPTAARQLRDERNKDKSLADIMDKVNTEVWKKFPSKQQQPQSVNQLNCGPLFLHPRHVNMC